MTSALVEAGASANVSAAFALAALRKRQLQSGFLTSEHLTMMQPPLSPSLAVDSWPNLSSAGRWLLARLCRRVLPLASADGALARRRGGGWPGRGRLYFLTLAFSPAPGTRSRNAASAASCTVRLVSGPGLQTTKTGGSCRGGTGPAPVHCACRHTECCVITETSAVLR